MNAEEFREALRKLGLPLTAARTAALLGVSPSGLSKYGYGYRPVRPSTARALQFLLMLDRLGLPPADVASRLKIMAWKAREPGKAAELRRRPGAS
ncbi:MAG TPA: helix-turn-helix transcriptional regulator [Steroidobacteraceae bacterium]|nr:helix-turn-helix transcriptional regulator [Steroidobacteraceae bacterium]